MDTAYRVSPLRLQDPTRLGDYALVGLLGLGGMGAVYLARNPEGRFVAIKLIHPTLAADPEFSGRFRSEVERARQVPSFCTAEFLGADLAHDPPYLVVEYVDGPTLAEVVDEQGPVRGGALHSLAAGIATALTGIHGAGVIHRDLKPDNVLLPPGSPKVIDFGIARPFEITSRHTRTDNMVGTVAYMAPERFSADPDTPITPAADIFAWGCVVTYAGTGRTPFHADSPPATAARILTQPPHLDGLPESLRGPVELALAKDPADRPTAPALLAMLIGEQPVPTPRVIEEPAVETPAPPLKGRALPLVLAALLLVAVLTIVGLVTTSGDDPAQQQQQTVALPSAVQTPPPSSRPSRPDKAADAPRPAGSPRTEQQALPSPAPSRSKKPSPSAAPSTSAAAPKAKTNPSGRNLALGRPVEASSLEGDPWSAAGAVDGDSTTRWSSAFSDPQWLRVDLGARYQISQVVLRWENSHATHYRVELSNDAKEWTTVYSTVSSAGGVATIPVEKVPGRYVRLYGTERSTQYGYSLWEFEVR
ncbi:protein kinase domain-containing protein [Symbioplanes lichenis]|uniref:protein kinase domain-containing protein n=1 Tax=Symbioplanes lichenis TaxID=1629072 RepID=UPI00273A5515|nr:discoidin domain-containing protein [Actinoplanes lichenis]